MFEPLLMANHQAIHDPPLDDFRVAAPSPEPLREGCQGGFVGLARPDRMQRGLMQA